MNKSHIGSDFDDVLREEKLLDGVEAAAVKRVLAFQVAQEMKRRQLSKAEMASRMKTSHAAVERLLDPQNTSITLATLGRAAAALGKNLSVEFTERKSRRLTESRRQALTQLAHRYNAPLTRSSDAQQGGLDLARIRGELGLSPE
jgi:antitoxin HicB